MLGGAPYLYGIYTTWYTAIQSLDMFTTKNGNAIDDPGVAITYTGIRHRRRK